MLLLTNKMGSGVKPRNFTTNFLKFREFLINHHRKIVSVLIYKIFGGNNTDWLGAIAHAPMVVTVLIRKSINIMKIDEILIY